MIQLRGMTWDHPRGYAPLEACSTLEGIQVEWSRRSLRDFGDTPLAELAKTFDLLIVDHPHVGMASQGWLLPLKDRMDLQSLSDENDTVSFRSYQGFGNTWALPVDAACQVSSRRIEFVPEAPSTWEEVFELDDRLKSEGHRVGMALCPTDTLCTFLTLSAQLGFPPKGKEWMPDSAVSEVLELMKEILDHVHPESVNWNPIRLYEAMTEQEEVVYCPLAFGYTDYSRPEKDVRLKFGGIPGEKGAVLGGAGVGVSAFTKHPELAVAMACHLAGEKIQTTVYTQFGGQPAHEAAWRSEQCDVWTGGFLSDTRHTLEQAFTRPRVAGWPAFQEKLGERIHAWLISGGPIHHMVKELKELHATCLSGSSLI